MPKGETNPNKPDVFGDSMMNKLRASSRKRRKRSASKKHRAQLGRLDARQAQRADSQ